MAQFLISTVVHFLVDIRTYGKEFFNEFKYLSDSRMHWQEDVYQVIESKAYERLHILTHPIWYGAEESTMQVQLKDFIRAQKYNCYDAVRDNIRDLDEVLLKADI